MGTLQALLSRLDPDPIVRGRQFEHICKWFLETDPIYAPELKRVWLWKDWPGRWGADAGIDLVAETTDGKLWAIQAKAYAPAYRVKKSDVDTFLSESSREVFSYRLLIATTNHVGATALRTLPADPPVGPSVDDLATALADLAPFRVTSPPKDVTIYGYSGKHLELTVPDMPFEFRRDGTLYTECTGFDWHVRYLMSWIAPHLIARGGYAFYGYTAPGHTEELWILDVEGTRLVIAADRSPGSPRRDLAELSAILDSIRIEP